MKIEKWDDVHGNTTPDDRMVAFLESSTDGSTGGLLNRAIVNHLIMVNGRLIFQLLNVPIRHETKLIGLVNVF